MEKVKFTVYGEPKGKGRPRYTQLRGIEKYMEKVLIQKGVRLLQEI